MRVIGGALRGRRLQVPDTLNTRPTLDATRESVFNILTSHFLKHGLSFNDLIVLDAFAGTGAFGIEALSRGATRAYFFENNPKSIQTLHQNIKALGLVTRSHVIEADVTHARDAPEATHLVFFDPPYYRNLINKAYDVLRARAWIQSGSLIVLEMAEDESHIIDNTEVLVEKKYRKTKIRFLQAK